MLAGGADEADNVPNNAVADKGLFHGVLQGSELLPGQDGADDLQGISVLTV